MQIKVREMQEENERLRRDNERFVRLIDSGEWGRGRVSELVSAGEILKGERDALIKLIQVWRACVSVSVSVSVSMSVCAHASVPCCQESP